MIDSYLMTGPGSCEQEIQRPAESRALQCLLRVAFLRRPKSWIATGTAQKHCTGSTESGASKRSGSRWRFGAFTVSEENI